MQRYLISVSVLTTDTLSKILECIEPFLEIPSTVSKNLHNLLTTIPCPHTNYRRQITTNYFQLDSVDLSNLVHRKDNSEMNQHWSFTACSQKPFGLLTCKQQCSQ